MRGEGVMDVDHGEESTFMAPLKVDVLPGIGHVRKRVLLEELNITLVREVAALDMGALKLVFGRLSYVIHERALGIDPTPVYPSPRKPAIAEEIILSEDENDDYRLLGILYGLVEKCSHRLRTRALVPGRAGLQLRYADQEDILRQIILPRKSCRDADLYKPLEALFFKLCRRRVRIRFMRVWFQGFSRLDPQLPLFPCREPGEGREKKAIQALDRIREKYGDFAIRYGRTAG
ncbi:MAG: DNA polymerase IV, partial [Deltaproteobacteria bacterium]|nr:DNA polymerase IV [Deltaproteobacteria bacterium]